MVATTAEDMLKSLDRGRLDARYWRIFALLALSGAVDFFDFFIVGYLVAVVGPQWHLTYGQSSVMLLGGGLGAICGALIWGPLADAWGRKTMLILGSFVCALAAGSLALVPDGDWVTFAVLRFFVGVGLAGCTTAATALSVEFAPTRYRTVITSLMVVFSTAGSFLAALTAHNLLGTLGWRGVAALGLVPALAGIIDYFALPESARWLTAKGRFEEARITVAWILHAPVDTIPLPTVLPIVRPGARLSELLRYPRLFAFVALSWLLLATAIYGVLLWGPTVVALLLKISAGEAAGYFVYITFAGIVGKVSMAFLAQRFGRKRCGAGAAFGAALALAAGAFFYQPIFLGGIPVFVIAMFVTVLFTDGEAANVSPWAVESYGVRLGARAAGPYRQASDIGRHASRLALRDRSRRSFRYLFALKPSAARGSPLPQLLDPTSNMESPRSV